MSSVLKPLVPHEPEAGPALNLEIAVTVLGLTVRRDASGNDVILHKGKEYALPDYSGDDAMALRVLNVLWKRGYWRWSSRAEAGAPLAAPSGCYLPRVASDVREAPCPMRCSILAR